VVRTLAWRDPYERDERERETRGNDDEDSDDLGDGTFDRLQDLIERLLPGHIGASSEGWIDGVTGGHQQTRPNDPSFEERSNTHDLSPIAVRL